MAIERSHQAFLIAGTDTNAGKTVLTTVLAAYWQRYYPHSRLGIMKPIQSGEGDREWYQHYFSLDQSPEEMTPLYFQAPLAPPIAAVREGRSIDLAKAWQVYNQLCQNKDLLLVESLGGLGSPITFELTVADWARDWQLPTLLVVPVQLGAIAHTVANVALARQAKVPLVGIVLNCREQDVESAIADYTPIDLIQSLTNIPVLGILPPITDFTDTDKLTQIASNLDLERLWGLGFI
ncbi:MAG: ATP-dependent dethiobiotin synthetase BioD [Desertifilum sp. SIO1I2]|nr:ATP-dependent dethiobiotin synthetase BioD [Desertifilum sp. SIO1I2]